MVQKTQSWPCAQVCSLIGGMIVAVVCCVFLSTTSAYADDTSAELSSLQQQIESTANEYNDATARVDDLQQQISDNQDRIDELNQELPGQEQRSSEAMKALYLLQQQGSNLINMVFGSETLNEFLSRVEYVDCIQQHNTAELAQLRSMKSEIEVSQIALDTAKKDADSEAARAQSALSDAQTARQAAQKKADEEAAAQVAAAQQAAAQQAAQQDAAAAQARAQQAVDNQNAQAASEDATATESPSAAPDTGGVNWSSDKASFVASWGARIDDYLSGSPLSGQGSVFASAAWDSGADPRWSPAISAVESTKGTYCFEDYNAWGWGSYSFSSWGEAIPAHVSYLSSMYGGYLTPEAAATYAADPSWYNKVLTQMNMI